MRGPFAHLDLESIQATEKKYHTQHPILWRVTKSVVFSTAPLLSLSLSRKNPARRSSAVCRAHVDTS